MIKKQFFIGNYGQTKIFIHLSLPIAVCIAWFAISVSMVPALGFGFGPVVNGMIAMLVLVALLLVTIGYDFGRLMLANSRGYEMKKLILLPISSLLIPESATHNPKDSMASGLLPTLPLILLAASFSLISLSPTAEPMQVAVLQQLSAFTLLFTIARLMGAFALDEANLLHSSLLIVTKNQRVADFTFQVARNFSIVGLLIIAVYAIPAYQWAGVALAITIALGLQDAIFYRRGQQKRISAIRSKFKQKPANDVMRQLS